MLNAEQIQAMLRGYGEGATLGFGKYVSAPLLMGTRALTGGRNLSYEEALAEVRAQQALAAQQNPGSYMAGNVVGSLAPMALTAGGSLPAVIAKNAAAGAAQGFTQSPASEGMGQTALDVALGAGIGGAVPAVGAAIQKGVGTAAKSAIKSANRDKVVKAFEDKDALFRQRADYNELLKATDNPAEAAQLSAELVRINRKLGKAIDTTNDFVRSKSGQSVNALTDQEAMKMAGWGTGPLGADIQGLLTGKSLIDRASVANSLGSGATLGLLGAGAGALGYGDPLSGAAIGAGIGALGPSILRGKIGTVARVASPVVEGSRYAGQPLVAGMGAARQIAAPQPDAMQQDYFSQFEEVQPAKAPSDYFSQFEEAKNQ